MKTLTSPSKRPVDHRRTKSEPVIKKQERGLSFDFWQVLKSEILGGLEPTTLEDSDKKRKTILNFIYELPKQFEGFVLFGCLICFDAFLSFFTTFPIRLFFLFLSFCKEWSSRLYSSSEVEIRLTPSQKWDLIRTLMILICISILSQFDSSIAYHWIRGQNVIKLYVIFNVLEVFDRLCCTFGQDVQDSIFSVDTDLLSVIGWLRISIGVLYVIVHTIVLFFQCIALNVAINSSNNLLLTLLVSNQFVELKGSVFKKCDEKNLFSIACADITERFQIVIFLSVVAIQNFGYNQWIFNYEEISRILWAVLFVVSSEVTVDWLKHSFIIRYNNLSPEICFPRFHQELRKTIVIKQSSLSDAQLASRVLGFMPLPLSCLVLRTLLSMKDFIGLHIARIWHVLLLAYVCGFFLKITIRYYLIYCFSHQNKIEHTN